MNYIECINGKIIEEVKKLECGILFGQNIDAGSCLSGLTRGLNINDKVEVINTPNIENTQVGIGFGLMMSGVPSAFFMKQQDFLLLGIDQLVNTYNYVRMSDPKASFSIVNIVVDQGYQGIQSSLNNFGDFCSIARVPGYVMTNKHDVECVIKNQLFRPGFRIIGVSQRLFGTEVIHYSENPVVFGESEIFRYSQGEDVTVVCFNFSFPQGWQLVQDLKDNGLSASLFSVNSCASKSWECVLEDVRRTRHLVVLDDSKSENRSCYHLTTAAYDAGCAEKVIAVTRQVSDTLLRPDPETFVVNSGTVIQRITQKSPVL